MLMQTIEKKSDVFTFGAHKGKEFGFVLELYPSYIVWCIEEGVLKVPKKFRQEAIDNREKELNARIRQSFLRGIRDEMDGWDGWLDE